ncbi:MAG: triose-phosphate isomerase [Eubacteriales bacterium]|nr:triose-phosphate isomerase [Eubacteriales bacterium]
MKPTIRTPYFETGIKCYIYGQDELDYAALCEACAVKYDIDVLFISSFTNIVTLAERFPHLRIIAPYMDNMRPGRGMGKVLPESLKAAGAHGVVINHCEKPMALADIRGCIERCRELEMLSCVCADTTEEAMAVAQLHPDIMNPEPAELIGSGQSADMRYVTRTVGAVKAIDSGILTEIAAGITRPEDVYAYIMAGSDGAGAASGILKSADPAGLLDAMVAAVRRAADDLKQRQG